MVKVGVVGTGFVGLTHAAVTARSGNHVVGYDSNPDKVKAFSSGNRLAIESHISEKNLADIVAEQLAAKRLAFSTDPASLADREVLFLCLPTPYKSNGESDLSYFFKAADDIVDVLLRREKKDFVVFADKSTVPIMTAKVLTDYLTKKGLENFDVASNPEFLPEGDAVNSAIHSHKVIVGANRPESFELFRKVYPNFANGPGYIETNTATAEGIKYASNALLFSQIVGWQAIAGEIAEAFDDVDFDTLRKGVLADSRIAKWGSYVSAGAGGSCFKKDALSLGRQLGNNGGDPSFINLVNDINERNKTNILKRAETEAKYDFNNKSVAILGAAFKQETNDVRESNVLLMVPYLLLKGARQIKIYDPLALDVIKREFDPGKNMNYSRISYHTDSSDVIKGTDAAIIATDHQEFHGLSGILVGNVPLNYFVIDGRRMIPSSDIPVLNSNGISYLPIAGKFRQGKIVHAI